VWLGKVAKGSGSFLKKRTKKRLIMLPAVYPDRTRPEVAKVFWFFFSKKNRLLLLSAVLQHL
jgi:hypothetical protein